VIFLIPKIAAHQAMLTADTIFKEHAITAILAILAKCRVVTPYAINTPIKQFSSADAKAFHATFCRIDAVVIVAITIVLGIKDHKAIFVASSIVCVICILIILMRLVQLRLRYYKAEF
jgi:uncharacterized membrane protein